LTALCKASNWGVRLDRWVEERRMPTWTLNKGVGARTGLERCEVRGPTDTELRARVCEYPSGWLSYSVLAAGRPSSLTGAGDKVTLLRRGKGYLEESGGEDGYITEQESNGQSCSHLNMVNM
jgi:hypothetical protein